MRKSLWIVPVLLLFAAFGPPASADPGCNAGNFSTIVGTTCAIGSLTFTFDGTYSYGGGWTASDLYFTPAKNGFTLGFLGGPQSLTANNSNPFNNVTFDELGLNFDVVAPQGYYLSGDDVSTNASFGASGIFAAAFPGIIAGSAAGGAGNYLVCEADQPPNCQVTSAYYPASIPLSSTASVNAIVFDLWAGSGTTDWNGAPSTFSFSLADSVPEPNSRSQLGLGLTGIGMLWLITAVRKRIALGLQ
jgi:hypothetical protein